MNYKLWIPALGALLIVNFTLWLSIGSALNLWAAGFMLGVAYMGFIEWYTDRKFNKQIMEEIETYSRNHPTLFDNVKETNNND